MSKTDITQIKRALGGDIKPGEATAIVGSVASGRTMALVKLMAIEALLEEPGPFENIVYISREESSTAIARRGLLYYLKRVGKLHPDASDFSPSIFTEDNEFESDWSHIKIAQVEMGVVVPESIYKDAKNTLFLIDDLGGGTDVPDIDKYLHNGNGVIIACGTLTHRLRVPAHELIVDEAFYDAFSFVVKTQCYFDDGDNRHHVVTIEAESKDLSLDTLQFYEDMEMT